MFKDRQLDYIRHLQQRHKNRLHTNPRAHVPKIYPGNGKRRGGGGDMGMGAEMQV